MVLFPHNEAAPQKAWAIKEILLLLPLYDGNHVFYSSYSDQPK